MKHNYIWCAIFRLNWFLDFMVSADCTSICNSWLPFTHPIELFSFCSENVIFWRQLLSLNSLQVYKWSFKLGTWILGFHVTSSYLKIKNCLSFWGSVPSDERPCRTLTFHNVLARQGSSFYNRARLNSQAFALCDTKVAAQEGCRVGQKKSYHFSFC